MSQGSGSGIQVTPVANNSPLNIGTMATDTWFEGGIGKVSIYNYLLTQGQITNHYQTMTGNNLQEAAEIHALSESADPAEEPRCAAPADVHTSSSAITGEDYKSKDFTLAEGETYWYIYLFLVVFFSCYVSCPRDHSLFQI